MKLKQYALIGLYTTIDWNTHKVVAIKNPKYVSLNLRQPARAYDFPKALIALSWLQLTGAQYPNLDYSRYSL